MKNHLFLPKQSTPPRQPDDLMQDMQERDDITSWALHPKQVDRSL